MYFELNSTNTNWYRNAHKYGGCGGDTENQIRKSRTLLKEFKSMVKKQRSNKDQHLKYRPRNKKHMR